MSTKSWELHAPGDLIGCADCGEENDYDSVLNVAKEKGVAQIKEQAKMQIKYELKKIFKKF